MRGLTKRLRDCGEVRYMEVPREVRIIHTCLIHDLGEEVKSVQVLVQYRKRQKLPATESMI